MKVLIVRSFHFSYVTSFPTLQRLIRARVSPGEGGAAGEESSGADRMMGEGDLQPQEEESAKEAAGVMGGGAEHKEEVEDEEGEDEDAPFKPFVLPGEWRKENNRLLPTVQVTLGFKKKTLNVNHMLPLSLMRKHSSLAFIFTNFVEFMLAVLIYLDSWLLCE